MQEVNPSAHWSHPLVEYIVAYNYATGSNNYLASEFIFHYVLCRLSFAQFLFASNASACRALNIY